MLLELTINHIALIESLRIEFAQGFDVLTGETGAGKSIVVDCMNLSLGGRADRDMIRSGAEKGSVQALFDISGNPAAKAMAEELGLDAEDGMVCVSRELSRSGRNICRIAGVPLPLNALRQFTSLLIDIHGQHEHQSLMNAAKHVEYLDGFGDADHGRLLEEVKQCHAARAAIAAQLRACMKDAAERERLADMLRFQVQEIESAKLKEGEEAKLEKKLHMLENAEKVQGAVETAYALTYAGDGGRSAQDALLQARDAMRGVASIDARFKELSETLDGLYIEVREAGSALQAIAEELSFDPALMERINARLDTIAKLERKYGATEAEVIAFGRQARERLEAVETSDAQVTELKKRLKAADGALREACARLTAARKAAAAQLEREILVQLGDLGMGKTRFSVAIEPLEKPTSNGADRIEFMIAPNPGEPMHPLAETASGGELSRIMLALKTISLNRGGVDSMIFDEIDTGVSGRMAQAVGEKMAMIASEKQVICVTHLPQIAALGDAQFLVEKRVEAERTRTNVSRLDREGRIGVLAAMIGGEESGETGRSHAAHMLDEASAVRERIRKLP